METVKSNQPAEFIVRDGIYYRRDTLSFRDQAALIALDKILGHTLTVSVGCKHPEIVSAVNLCSGMAYAVADAMVAEREKRSKA